MHGQSGHGYPNRRFVKIQSTTDVASMGRHTARRKLPTVQSTEIRLSNREDEGIPRLNAAKSQVSHLAIPPETFDTLTGKKMMRENNLRLTLSKQIQLLEILNIEHRHASDVKQVLGIRKQNLSRLIKNGLVQTTWDKSGIGTFIEITGKGKKELRRLRAAARMESDSTIIRKSLVHLKNTQFSH
jgi:DNA-binding PadR family transcriptional regulator